jgi:choline kinase
MRAVILAAGVGARLAGLTGGAPKVLTRIGGESLIRRSLRLLAHAGVREAVVVLGHGRSRVRASVAGSPIPVRFVFNPHYAETQTFFSLMLTRSLVADEPFLKLNGDVIFDAEILDRLIAGPAACAYAIDEHAILDEEAMKVELGADGRVARIGKNLAVAGAFGESIGIEKISPPFSAVLFDQMEAAAAAGERKLYYEDTFQRAMNEGLRFDPVCIGDLRWSEIDDERDHARAVRLFESPRPTADEARAARVALAQAASR